LDSQAAGGSGADIDQSASVPQPCFSGKSRLYKRKRGSSYRGHRRELALDHCLGDV
jgi:hypothetical protein